MEMEGNVYTVSVFWDLHIAWKFGRERDESCGKVVVDALVVSVVSVELI